MEETWILKIVSDIGILQQNKQRNWLFDTEALQYHKMFFDSCYMSTNFNYWKVPLPVSTAQG